MNATAARRVLVWCPGCGSPWEVSHADLDSPHPCHSCGVEFRVRREVHRVRRIKPLRSRTMEDHLNGPRIPPRASAARLLLFLLVLAVATLLIPLAIRHGPAVAGSVVEFMQRVDRKVEPAAMPEAPR